MNPSTRRAFLASSSAFIALPFLESFGFRRFGQAAEATNAAPKRMIFLGMGYGVTSETWYPNIKTSGYEYELTESLLPLAKYKKKITVFQNLEHANSRDGHSGSTFWLTGADRYAIPGQSFHNTISVDQVAAAKFGNETRFTSLHLNGGDDSGHGPGSISWNNQGKPIVGMPHPVAMYHKLFSSDNMPLAERQSLLADDRSALDTVLADARSVTKGLTKTDKDKLDEYFQSIREIEIRIAKDEKWLTVPKKHPESQIKEPSETLEGIPEVEMAYELMLSAARWHCRCEMFHGKIVMSCLANLRNNSMVGIGGIWKHWGLHQTGMSRKLTSCSLRIPALIR